MKRLLVAAPERDLTRFVAESLLERSVDGPPRADDAWDIARAHTALEARLLVTHGGRPFDAAVLDQGLGADELLGLLETLAAQASTPPPIFVLTERGRDRHVRRVATEDDVARLLEMMKTGGIGAPVIARHPIDRAAEAVAQAAEDGRDGKVLLLGPEHPEG